MLVVQYGQILRKWDSCFIWGRWRLVHGEELYDLQADPGESGNVVAQRPEVLKKMRDHYETWWTGIEPTLRDFCPISIGSAQENPVTLTSSDWQEVYCDNVQSILKGDGGPRGAPWNVQVERGGEYEIALRRWPAKRALPLAEPCPERQMTAGKLPAGKAMPIAAARLVVAGQELSVKTAPSDEAAVFRTKLRGGVKTHLHGWFQDAAGSDLCGAYYASVRRL
jgi:hypothetical protein